jgi:hypothetical protein
MDAVLGWNLVLSLPVILVIVWLAGRLLGVLRSLPASVWVELLAGPGALARAQRGLVSIHTLRAVRRSSQRLSRYAQITGIAVKHGFGPLLGLGQPATEDPAAPPAAPAARRLRLALVECGGMFVKLGQVLSTRAELLPAGVVAELSRLQDQVARRRRTRSWLCSGPSWGGPWPRCSPSSTLADRGHPLRRAQLAPSRPATGRPSR